ncbi:MAG: carboxymuconolactone decarboxylase family protein [Myxococcales bacterium]|nr:carboxymuconolactone decarboxylase family protein [Myxococcales bacterium]
MADPKLSVYSLRSLGRALRRPTAWLGRSIGAALRERIILRVSAVNRCYVCSTLHGRVARHEGLSHADVAAARAADESLDLRTRVALRFAEVRTVDLESEFPDDVTAFERAFSAAEQAEVRAIVDLFTFNNRFNNTWEAVLPGAGKRRDKLGL